MKKILSLLAATAAMNFSVHASAISQWTFETSLTTLPTTAQTAGATVGPFTPEVGNGAATSFHSAAATYSVPSGNGSAKSFSANGWSVNDYFQFSLSTVGFSNIFVTYGETGSNTGPGAFSFNYSTDGGTTFTLFNSYNITNDSWAPTSVKTASEKTFDLSSITALNNNANVVFRIIDTSTTAITGGTVASTGTSRVDDFYVSSDTPILPVAAPEPSTLVGLALGSAFLIARRRRALRA